MSETALLEAVRDQIRTVCGYVDAECEVEIDDQAPADVGQVYVVVTPNAWRFGPTNNPSGGVLDEIFEIKVTIVVRAADQPRDRRRGLLLENLSGINSRLRAIVAAIHFNTDVHAAANAIIANDEESTEGFVEMLRFGGMTPRAEVCGADFFKAQGGSLGDMTAGLKRSVLFTGARRIQHRTSMT